MQKISSVDARLSTALEHLKSGWRDLARRELTVLVAENPDNVMGLYLLGNMSYEEGDPVSASSFFRRALEVDPLHADIWCNLATAEFQSDQFVNGFRAIDQALTLSPHNARAYAIRGSAHARRKNDADALNDFASALKLNPHDRLSAIYFWVCACRLCWWTHSESLVPQITQLVTQGSPLVPPFSLLSVIDDPKTHLTCAINRARKFTPAHPLSLRVRPSVDTRYRVAYLSADFHEHATTYLMAGVFERHDKRLVETIGVSIGSTAVDAVRTRVANAFDQFVDAHSWSDIAVAQWLIDREVHILVDLKGHTEFARPGIVALKPAPLVVSYLGYPGSSGITAVDYIIGDAVVTPFRHQAHFCESIVQLPHTYQCNDQTRHFPEQRPSRELEGLPADALVLASFNHPYKIRPEVFDAWCRILHRLPDSILWVLSDQPQTQVFLLQRAKLLGISADRFVFAKRIKYEEHLARHVLADLFLDTWPCSAHTTASDALWMGLPVLTLMGQSFASRVAASLLQCVGLHDLVVEDLSTYEEKAVELGQNRAALVEFRERLDAMRMSTPLFDTAAFTRHLESAYAHMIKRWQSGALPTPFSVQEDGSVVEAVETTTTLL